MPVQLEDATTRKRNVGGVCGILGRVNATVPLAFVSLQISSAMMAVPHILISILLVVAFPDMIALGIHPKLVKLTARVLLLLLGYTISIEK